MDIAVQFNNQSQSRTIKINNVPPDAMLTSKLITKLATL